MIKNYINVGGDKFKRVPTNWFLYRQYLDYHWPSNISVCLSAYLFLYFTAAFIVSRLVASSPSVQCLHRHLS